MDRRFKPEGAKFQIQHMWELHHNIVRLLLLNWSVKDIAEQLGVHPKTVTTTKNSEIVKRKLDLMRAARDKEAIDVAVSIKNLAPKAIEVIEGILDSDTASAKDRLTAAKDVLDRAGYMPVQKSLQMHGYLTPEEIEEIKARARATGMISEKPEPKMIDITPNQGGTEDEQAEIYSHAV